MSAFAKCGISWEGIDTDLLTQNPQVTNAPNRPVAASQFAAAQIPTQAATAPVELGRFVTPSRVREGSLEYYRLRAEHFEAESKSLQLNPQMISDLQAENLKLTAGEMALAGAMMVELTDPEQRRLATRRQLNYKPDGSVSVMTVTGMLSKNVGLREQLLAQREECVDEAAAKATKQVDLMMLRDQYLKCLSGTACSCGGKPCVTKTYKYCQGCDVAGRNSIQKSVSKKLCCVQGKIEAGASLPPPPAVPSPATAVTSAADVAGSAGLSATQERIAVAAELGTTPRLPRAAADNDFVWTFAGLRDGESVFNHRFQKDTDTDEPCVVTQTDLPKGAKVHYPQNHSKRRRVGGPGQSS